MSSNGKKQTKLQLRMYPERNEQHRRALAWLTEHKTAGASYADLVSKAICSQIDQEQRMDAEERMRQLVREEIRRSLHGAAISEPQVEPQNFSEGNLRKAKDFMSGLGFG